MLAPGEGLSLAYQVLFCPRGKHSTQFLVTLVTTARSVEFGQFLSSKQGVAKSVQRCKGRENSSELPSCSMANSCPGSGR